MNKRDRITFDITPEVRVLLEKLRQRAADRLGGRVSEAQAIRIAIIAEARRRRVEA